MNTEPHPEKKPRPSRHRSTSQKTSWKGVSDWYDSLVGEKGHYYHRELIIPNVLRLLALADGDRLLDIGCGQGVLSRHIPQSVDYVGLDIAAPLLEAARQYHPSPRHRFLHADLTLSWPLSKHPPFSHAACILALQNIEKPEWVFKELSAFLCDGGRAVIVMNHPCFRIPRQSHWHVDEKTGQQRREIASYMSSQRIPIMAHPGRGGETTWTFHRPLTDYAAMAHDHGFVIEMIEEWCSPKQSTGSAARAENRARKEFPLFMALVLRTTANKAGRR